MYTPPSGASPLRYIYNKVYRSLGAVAALLLLLLTPARSAAQSDAQLSQYYEVPSYYNPSATGLTDLLRIRVGARLQWAGIHNAPQSFIGVADMPFKFMGKRFGVGLVAQQESYGLYKNLNIGAQISYKFKLLGGQLGIGAQLGFIDQSFKGTDVSSPDNDDYHQGTDDAIPQQDIRGNAFDVGAGIYYSGKHFWAGISGTHLTKPSVKLNADSGEGSTERNYEFTVGRTVYLMAGSNIPIKNTLFELQPSPLVKSDFTFYTGEATMRARYNKMLSFGVGYRWKDAVYATVSADIKGFFAGFSYDYPLTSIAKASSGSYELFVGYSLKLDFSEKNRHRQKSVRIM